MTLAPPGTQPLTPRARTWAVTLLVAAAVGVAVAVAAVYAYYNDPWRPLAHTFGVWAVMASAVAFRRPPALAVGASTAALAAAVVTFYTGLKVGHDIRWAASGSVMGVDWDKVQLWLVLAVLAGVVFGLVGSFAGRREWTGALATAGLLGLLAADAYRRSTAWGGVDVAVVVDVVAALAVFVLASRSNRRPLLTVVLTIAVGALGLVAVSAPDLIEQVLVEGS